MGIVLGCQHFPRLPCVVFAMRIHNRVCLGRNEEEIVLLFRKTEGFAVGFGGIAPLGWGHRGMEPPILCGKGCSAKCEGAIVSVPCFAQIPLLLSDVGALPPNPGGTPAVQPGSPRVEPLSDAKDPAGSPTLYKTKY